MANAIPSRSGQINKAGDAKALFLKVFAGEVLTIFEAENVTVGRTMKRTIESGKSAQFPIMGRAEAYYHTPGNEILGGQIAHAERIIHIQKMLISPVFIPEIDEAMNHYEVRSHYSTEVGRVLAQTWDKHVLQVGILAARTTVANITGESPAGTTITEDAAGDFQDPEALVAAFYAAAQALDEKNVPNSDRYAYVRPAEFYRLIRDEKLMSREFSTDNGDYAKGILRHVSGITVVKTNNLPNTNITAGTTAGGSDDGFVGNFTKTAGLVMHKSAVGTVQLLGLSTRSDYDPRRLGELVVSKKAVGHGVLRPESAVELAYL